MQKVYDLEKRTAEFGKNIIKFCKKIPRNSINNPIITQLVKCGTSTGANYCEADNAESPSDFVHKIGICKKESREAKHFLQMIAISEPGLQNEASILEREAIELNLIFNSIYNKVKNKNKRIK